MRQQRPSYLASQIAQNFEGRVKLLQPSLSPERITQRLLDWTGGQPFLTYRLYELLIQGPLASWALPAQPLPNSPPVFDPEAAWVDRYVQSKLVKNCRDPELVRHLREICRAMIHDPRSLEILKLYRRLLAGRHPQANLRNDIQLRLVQSGIAKVEEEYLVLSNRFYREIFNHRWLARAVMTVEARLRDEAVAAIAKVFSESQATKGEIAITRPLHPELQDESLLLANNLRGTDCLLLPPPPQSFAARPNLYRPHHHRSVYHLAVAMVACTLGAMSIVMMVNFSRGPGEARFEPPSMLQIREFLRDLRR